MSYLKQAAAIAGLTIATTTANAQIVNIQNSSTASATANASAQSLANIGNQSGAVSGYGGNVTSIRSNAQLTGSVSTDGIFKVRINNGPMAGQTISIDTARERFQVTTYPSPSETVTEDVPLSSPVSKSDYEIGKLLEGDYKVKTGSLVAACTVEKNSNSSIAGKVLMDPQYISYQFNCKTNFGHAYLNVTPHNNKGAYAYNTQAIINSDPETGRIISIETPWPQTDITFKPSQP